MKFVPQLERIKIYEAGKPIELVVREFGIEPKDVIKLASNENPNGCSPKVTKKIAESAHLAFRYPDDSMYLLKERLGAKYGVASKNIIIGAGSDQVIEFVVHAKCHSGDKVLQSKTTFAMYEVYSAQCDAQTIRTESHHHVIDEFIAEYKKHNPKVVFLCTPNNPLGECLDRDEVYRFLDAVSQDTLVAVDCAYMEYAAFKDSKKKIDPKELIERYPNAIYLGTFSKAYGLGGMRVGYGIAQNEIMDALYKLRPPFNITTLSLAAAIEALEDGEFVLDSLKMNFEEMGRYVDFCNNKGFKYIESYTNFITILFDGTKYDSSQLSDALLKKGVIVRNLKSYGLNGIRITIGKPEENTIFFQKIEQFL